MESPYSGVEVEPVHGTRVDVGAPTRDATDVQVLEDEALVSRTTRICAVCRYRAHRQRGRSTKTKVSHKKLHYVGVRKYFVFGTLDSLNDERRLARLLRVVSKKKNGRGKGMDGWVFWRSCQMHAWRPMNATVF